MSTPGSVSNHLEAVILIVLTYFNLPLLVTSTKYITHCNRYSHGKPSILCNQQLERRFIVVRISYQFLSNIDIFVSYIKTSLSGGQVKTLISFHFLAGLPFPGVIQSLPHLFPGVVLQTSTASCLAWSEAPSLATPLMVSPAFSYLCW